MEYFIGQIILMPNKYIPKGFLVCNGRELTIGDHSALASVLGYNYNDTTGKFRIPTKTSDMGGYSYCICHDGIYPNRDDNESSKG